MTVMYKLNLMVVLVAHPLPLFGLVFFFFLPLLATCRDGTMLDEQWWRRERERERERGQTILGLEIGLKCNK